MHLPEYSPKLFACDHVIITNIQIVLFIWLIWQKYSRLICLCCVFHESVSRAQRQFLIFFLLACLHINLVSLAAGFRHPAFLTNKWLLSFAPHSFPDLSQSQLLFYFLEQVCTKLTFDMLSNHNIKYQQFPQGQTVEWCPISQL